MNRAGEKDTLITYERALEAQADLRKFRGSTIERKHMSTKTTFKRVALVAVAALGLGVLSVAPSQAASQADSLTLSTTTATQLTGETLTATSATTTLSFLGANVGDTMSVSAFLTSAPAGNTKLPKLVLVETTTAHVAATAPVVAVLAGAELGQVAQVAAAGSTVAASAKFSVYMDGPTLPGTYVIKLTPAVTAGGGVLNATAQTLTITVTSNPSTSTVATSATIVLNAGETSSATTDAVVTASKTADAANAAATLTVALLNAAGKSVTAESYTATITGAGTLGMGANSGSTITGPNATGRALTAINGHVIQVFADGTSGVGTITITSAAGVVLGSKTVTFFGAPATMTATAAKTVIGVGSGLADVLSVVVKDSAGTLVSNLNTFGVVSSDTTKISTVYGTAKGSYTASTGVYLIPVSSVAAGTANLTVTTNASATDTTGISAAAVAVRVGSTTPASVKITTDKTSYAPGEKATITVALADATGLDLVSGETYTAIFKTGGITSSYTLGTGSDSLTGTSVVGYTAAGKTYSVFMPVTEGDVTFSWTTGSTTSAAGTGLALANQAIAGSVTVAVSSNSTAAALDAANEATDAANAATDAALAAADAADAATAAAEDASAAVAKLAKSVNTQLKALKKQLTSLIALVNKLR
jgi:hypothetical protein